MGPGRVFGKSLALISLVFLVQCGGVGVAKRSDLTHERPGGREREKMGPGTSKKADVDKDSQTISKNASSIEKYFQKWLNTPYLFGGESYSGVDCSGLVNRFFSDFYGVSVPRTTESLYIDSQAITAGRAVPGDLVFFKNTYRPGISHVGIYLGDNRFVHASNSGVIISNLDESYFKSRFVGFMRIEH